MRKILWPLEKEHQPPQVLEKRMLVLLIDAGASSRENGWWGGTKAWRGRDPETGCSQFQFVTKNVSFLTRRVFRLPSFIRVGLVTPLTVHDRTNLPLNVHL